MKTVISIRLDERLDNTKVVLKALKQCDGIREYKIIIHTNNRNKELHRLVKGIGFEKNKPAVKFLGGGTNNYLILKQAFEEADFVISMTNEMIPSRDCLRYMEHCRNSYFEDQSVFSVATYNSSFCDWSRHYAIRRRSSFTANFFGLWKNRWEWIKDSWAKDPGRQLVHFKNELSRYTLYEVYPLLSRSLHLNNDSLSKQGPVRVWAGSFNLKPGRYSESRPLVTAVMLTGLHKARYHLAQVAIKCFKEQSYPNKELLILNHGEKSLFCDDHRIRELRFKKSERQTVGDLRNLGLKFANGDFIINWDDDDWHHPRRIEVQMGAQQGNAAVLLKNRIHYSFVNDCARYSSHSDGAESTILHPRKVNFKYPSLLRGSDTIFADKFEQRICLNNDAGLFIRFYHGLNLWDASHIMKELANPEKGNELQISSEHQQLLDGVLKSYKNLQPSSITIRQKPTSAGPR